VNLNVFVLIPTQFFKDRAKGQVISELLVEVRKVVKGISSDLNVVNDQSLLEEAHHLLYQLLMLISNSLYLQNFKKNLSLCL
jgi:hypothetical protein